MLVLAVLQADKVRVTGLEMYRDGLPAGMQSSEKLQFVKVNNVGAS